ncbi:unnamed protein product [Lymnaea stagnalis]|uniref:AIG1-type G domain-containing protein n=1 Tax=Lymnaea stagnalis TaxID=6523 RepID=A0AAV2HGN0_LYMST
MVDSEKLNINFRLDYANRKIDAEKQLTVLTPLYDTGRKSNKIQGVIKFTKTAACFAIIVRNENMKEVHPYPFDVTCKLDIKNSDHSDYLMNSLKTDASKSAIEIPKVEILKAINGEDQFEVTWQLNLEWGQETGEKEIKECTVRTNKSDCQSTFPIRITPDFKTKDTDQDLQVLNIEHARTTSHCEKSNNFLLIGRSGTGKSSTGNSILGDHAFEMSSDHFPLTQEVAYADNDHYGHIIKVIDTPGVPTSVIESEAKMAFVVRAMTDAIMSSPEGYHAILLVLRYGQRFTQHDTNIIHILKRIFGEMFVHKFCIIVMTGGDHFEKESKRTRQTFEEWCQSQAGGLRDLLLECDHRIVVFDNVTSSEEIREKQFFRLIAQVKHMSSKGLCYTNKHFGKYNDSRTSLMVEIIEPMISDEVLKSIRHFENKFSQIKASEDINYKYAQLRNLKLKTEAQKQTILDLDRGTNRLNKQLQSIDILIDLITNKLPKSIPEEKFSTFSKLTQTSKLTLLTKGQEIPSRKKNRRRNHLVKGGRVK